jgi:Putative AphA-like transcriptional regulator
MKPSDVALLVVLGTADSGPVSLEEMIGAARMLAPRDWRPTADTVRSCAERAILRGHLRPVHGDGAGTDTAFETTAAGRAVIVELLRQPIGPSCSSSIRACMSAKLCFLHHLPQEERPAHGETLAQLYRDAIENLRRSRRLSHASAEVAGCAVSHEIVRMESELAWLDAMRRCQAGNGRLVGSVELQDDTR